jgi:aerobic-type carbon monoxide dehydrogenase small subunit (CoxS/CutS family)
MLKKILMSLRVNGEATEVAFAPHKTLLEVLREDLGLTGTKHGCELGECGSCAVLFAAPAATGEVPGADAAQGFRPVLSCLMLALEAEGGAVRTVEGLAERAELSPLQAAFADLGAAQCGYCTPAMLLTAQALLDENPGPSRDQIKAALAGVLCRCTGYLQIFDAVEEAARRLRARAEALSAHGHRPAGPGARS